MNDVLGIPRGLDYYLHYPFWQAFFACLGVRTVVSPPTNRGIVDLGAARSVDGCCLPLKVYVGHVLALAEQGVSTFFVPHLISICRREYICPYFLGLPDLVARYLPRTGVKILSPVIDMRRGAAAVAKNVIAFGAQWGGRRAARAFWQARAAFCRWRCGQIAAADSTAPTVLVLGHRYVLADSFLNHGVIHRLQEANFCVLTPYQLPERVLREGARTLPKRMFWTSARQSLGALNACADKASGVITLAAFACGPDSLFSDIIHRRARQMGLPSLLLNVDEHTGAAGAETRLEAFLDMLARRRSQ